MKKSGQLIIGLIVAIAAVYYTMRNVSVSELMDSFRQINYIWLLPTFVLMCLTYVARAIRWRVLLLPVREEVKTLDFFSPLMVGFMAGALPSRAGELIRAYLLGKKFELSFASSLATIVVERLFDMILLLFLFSWILVFHGEIFDGNIAWSGISIEDLAFQFGIFSLVLVLVLIAFIYLLTFHNERAMSLVHWLVKPFPEKWQYKLIQMTETFSQGLGVFHNIKALVYVGVATAAVWALIVLQYYPLYWAYDLHDKSAASLILLTVMVCILITVLPTPAFLGSFNAGVLIALHEIMGEAEVATVSFGFVAWGVNFAVIVLGGVYFILHDHISVKKLVEIDEEV